MHGLPKSISAHIKLFWLVAAFILLDYLYLQLFGCCVTHLYTLGSLLCANRCFYLCN